MRPDPSIEEAGFKTLSKQELHALADGLLSADPKAVDCCVKFVTSETKGHWHGRARAMMCRRLKHCTLGLEARVSLLRCILGRLKAGDFSEQFKDQLRLALHLDARQTFSACEEALSSARPYVQRYAAWALALPRGENAA